jgi:hypothetical protein
LSILNITSNPLTVPYLSRASTGSTTSATSTLFQQLAADAQAVLLQGSNAAAQPAPGTGATTGSATNVDGSTAALAPQQQQMASSLQSFLSQLQEFQAEGGPSTPSETQTTSADQAQPRHHHHHRQFDGSSTDASTSGGTSAASPASASQNSASSGDQTLSAAFAASIGQALQAYIGRGAPNQGPAAATLSLTV